MLARHAEKEGMLESVSSTRNLVASRKVPLPGSRHRSWGRWATPVALAAGLIRTGASGFRSITSSTASRARRRP
jgi:hypothetical protein